MQSLATNLAEASQTTQAPVRDRRRCVRQKVHTPAYASLTGASRDEALNPSDIILSEIVDISETGIFIRTTSTLRPNCAVNLCLDLPETKAYIRASGRIIRSDAPGRGAIQLLQMQDADLRQLRQWLFANAVAACVNYVIDREAAEAEAYQAAYHLSADGHPVGFENAALEPETCSPADYTAILSALAAVKREVESLGSDLDAALHLIARRAQAFTRAGAAAIAVSEGDEIVCRATAGPAAPSLGARLKAGAGFTGECVRSRRLLRCEDSETDQLADRESCRALGVRSMIAVPIFSEDAVTGVLEVFASEPHNFNANDDVVLDYLAEIVSAAVQRAGAPLPTKPAPSAMSVDDEFPVETPADLPIPQLAGSRRALLLAVAATLLLVMVRLIGPWGNHESSADTGRVPEQAKPALVSRPPEPSGVTGEDDLRRLAMSGDAPAQFAMGVHFATGEGVPQDYAQAVHWFSRAAEQGHVPAQAMLGDYYWAGRGVPQDLIKAYSWSVLAQAGGDEASRNFVAVLAARMTHAQIATAQQQADDWIRQHPPTSKKSPIIR